MQLLSRWLTNSLCSHFLSLIARWLTRPSSQHFTFASALRGGPSPSPVIRAVKLQREMSNVCLMGVGWASIKLIVDHWVNFSYLEKPSFPKCCESGGYDGRLWVKTEGWLASNIALHSVATFMGFSDSNDDDDEDLVLMIVLVRRGEFSVCIRGAQYVHYHISMAIQFVLRFTVESDVSSWLSPVK